MKLLLLFLRELQANQIDVPNFPDLLTIAGTCPYFNSSVPLTQATQTEWIQVCLHLSFHSSNATPFRPKHAMHHSILFFVCYVVTAIRRTGTDILTWLQVGNWISFIPFSTRMMPCQKKAWLLSLIRTMKHSLCASKTRSMYQPPSLSFILRFSHTLPRQAFLSSLSHLLRSCFFTLMPFFLVILTSRSLSLLFFHFSLTLPMIALPMELMLPFPFKSPLLFLPSLLLILRFKRKSEIPNFWMNCFISFSNRNPSILMYPFSLSFIIHPTCCSRWF